MYLGKTKIALKKVIAVLLIIFSGFFVFIGVCGVFLASSRLINGIEKEKYSEYLYVYIVLIISFGMLLGISINMFRLAGKANKFNSIFENDPDGQLSVEKTALLFGMPVFKFVKLFDKLVKKGYLVNCSLDNSGEQLLIVLNNGGRSTQQKFDIINCPHCGAANDIKLGFVEKCKYCGNKLPENEADDAEVKK